MLFSTRKFVKTDKLFRNLCRTGETESRIDTELTKEAATIHPPKAAQIPPLMHYPWLTFKQEPPRRCFYCEFDDIICLAESCFLAPPKNKNIIIISMLLYT